MKFTLNPRRGNNEKKLTSALIFVEVLTVIDKVYPCEIASLSPLGMPLNFI